jgi:ubiquitin-conjugating enzyme E2 S
MKVVIGPEYPAAPPKGYFLTKIYHPNVASNGDICVNTLKRDWTPDVVLKHVFQVIRCLLIVPFPESSLNDEAGKLFMDSYDEFARRARILTEVHAMGSTTENPHPTSASSKEEASGAGSSAVAGASSSSTLANVMLESAEGSAADIHCAPVKAAGTKASSSAAAAAKKKSLKRL